MFIDYEKFEQNLRSVQESIERAEALAGKAAGSTRLLPVTKNHPLEAAQYALRAGLPNVGENRVQEALGKMEGADEALNWELIGPLQSNKAKKVAERFYRVQSVDRAKIVHALQRHAEEADRTLRILLQINAGNDPAKSGARLEDAPALLDVALGQSHLKVDGLMTIAPLDENPEVARRCFAALRECRDRLSDRFGVELAELSMGMSGDMAEAIVEGSTMVRVGTALYGERNYE